jgi:chemotaxis signal transduction protein
LIGRQGERWAFAVDSVEGIRRVEDAQMLPPPATVRHAADGCTKYLVRTEAVGSASTEGVASANNAAPPLVHVLDVDRLTALFARSLA